MKLFLTILILLVFNSCSQKNIDQKHIITVQKQAIQTKRILPYSKDIYSLKKFARFMYQKDCNELKFRKDDLMESEFIYDPLDTIEIISEIEKDLIKNRCY